MSVNNAIASAIGGWPQGLMQGITPWNGTSMPTQQLWPPVQPQTANNTQQLQWPLWLGHQPVSANQFKSLTAYIRKLLACEPACECAWCKASELERQVAIAQFFKDEPVEEPVAP